MKYKNPKDPIDAGSTDVFLSVLLDESADTSIRKNIMYILPANEKTFTALKEVGLNSPNEEVAFMAIKVLNAHPESKRMANDISDSIIADPKTKSRRLLAAMDVKAESYRCGREEFDTSSKARFIGLARDIIECDDDFSPSADKASLKLPDKETAAQVLVNLRDIDAIRFVLRSEHLDTWIKQVCVAENYMVLTACLSADPSLEDVRLAVDAANIWAVDEIVSSLEDYFIEHPGIRSQLPALEYIELIPADKKMLEY